MNNNAYGMETILDLHDCKRLPVTREDLTIYFRLLCSMIDMQRCDLHFWDYTPEVYANAPPHLKGVSAVQFIETSNITIHTLDTLKKVFINVFSCKQFDPKLVRKFSLAFFDGELYYQSTFDRT